MSGFDIFRAAVFVLMIVISILMVTDAYSSPDKRGLWASIALAATTIGWFLEFLLNTEV